MNENSLMVVAGLVAIVLVWNAFISMNQAADSAALSNLELESCAARHSSAIDSIGETIQQVAFSPGLELSTHYSVSSVTYPCSEEAMKNPEIKISQESELSCIKNAPSPNCFSITFSTDSFSIKRFYSLGNASFSSATECIGKTGFYPVGTNGFGFGDFRISNSLEKVCIYKVE